jgi:hypothetical protein
VNSGLILFTATTRRKQFFFYTTQHFLFTTQMTLHWDPRWVGSEISGARMGNKSEEALILFTALTGRQKYFPYSMDHFHFQHKRLHIGTRIERGQRSGVEGCTATVSIAHTSTMVKQQIFRGTGHNTFRLDQSDCPLGPTLDKPTIQRHMSGRRQCILYV